MVVVARNLKYWTWPFGTRDALHLSEKQKTREKVHLCFRLIKPITITIDELGPISLASVQLIWGQCLFKRAVFGVQGDRHCK